MANEMAFVHNAFIRGFNAIILQGPHVPSNGQPGYNAQDVKDFLFFTHCLIKGLHHHHDAEETMAFPEIEREIGKPGYMSIAADQHAAFHDGLYALWDFSKKLQDKPEEWTWDAMHKLFDGFMPALQEHLAEEVDLFLSLDQFEEEGLRRAWKAAENEGKKVGIAGFVCLSDSKSYEVC
jgi:hemerythrin-like domain-containing protein